MYQKCIVEYIKPGFLNNLGLLQFNINYTSKKKEIALYNLQYFFQSMRKSFPGFFWRKNSLDHHDNIYNKKNSSNCPYGTVTG